MFEKLKIEDHVPIIPELLENQETSVRRFVDEKYLGKIIRNHGMVMSLYSIDRMGEYKIGNYTSFNNLSYMKQNGMNISGNSGGIVYSRVVFSLVMFMPRKGEQMLCIVRDLKHEMKKNEINFQINFFQNIICPKKYWPKNSQIIQNENDIYLEWKWINEQKNDQKNEESHVDKEESHVKNDQNDKEESHVEEEVITKLYIGELARVRVEKCVFHEERKKGEFKSQVEITQKHGLSVEEWERQERDMEIRSVAMRALENRQKKQEIVDPSPSDGGNRSRTMSERISRHAYFLENPNEDGDGNDDKGEEEEPVDVEEHVEQDVSRSMDVIVSMNDSGLGGDDWWGGTSLWDPSFFPPNPFLPQPDPINPLNLVKRENDVVMRESDVVMKVNDCVDENDACENMNENDMDEHEDYSEDNDDDIDVDLNE